MCVEFQFCKMKRILESGNTTELCMEKKVRKVNFILCVLYHNFLKQPLVSLKSERMFIIIACNSNNG